MQSNTLRALLCICLFLIPLTPPLFSQDKIPILILSGANNHNWRTSTPVLRQILTATNRFTVTVTENPATMTAANLQPYAAIISNWNTFTSRNRPPHPDGWSRATRQAYLDFVRQGKGHVVVHAGSSSFYKWPEYQELVISSFKVGTTSHGRQHSFPVTIADGAHPITKGMRSFYIYDELWHRAPVKPAGTVLARAFSSRESGGTGNQEPVAMVRRYGQGRSFTLLLGHDARTSQNPAFQHLLVRGTEWAATGKATIAPPAAWPSSPLAARAVVTSTKKALAQVCKYEPGRESTPLRIIREKVYAAGNRKEARSHLAGLLGKALTDNCTPGGTKFICHQLSLIGGAAQVPQLAGLLLHPELSLAARGALEKIPHPTATDALLAALTKASGRIRLGLIASLGARGDQLAVPALITDLSKPALPRCLAAVKALGRIGGEAACQALVGVLTTAEPDMQVAAGQALLKNLDPRWSAKILPLLLDQERPLRLRRQAFPHALRCMPEAKACLQGALAADSPPFAQSSAIQGVKRLPRPEFLAIMVRMFPHLHPLPKVQAITLLAEKEVTAALPGITPLVKDPHPLIKMAAIKASVILQGAAAIPRLVELLKSASTEVKQCIHQTLATCADPAADQTLTDILTRSDQSAGRPLIQILIDRQARLAIPTCIKLLDHPDPKLASAAVRALGKLGGVEALPPLVARLAPGNKSIPIHRIQTALGEISRRLPAPRAKPILALYQQAGPQSQRALLKVLAILGGKDALKVVTKARGPEALRALASWRDENALPALLKKAGTNIGAKEKVVALRGIARLLPQATKRPPGELASFLGKALELATDRGTKEKLISCATHLVAPETLAVLAPLLKQPEIAGATARCLINLCRNLHATHPAPVQAALKQIEKVEVDPATRKQLLDLKKKFTDPKSKVFHWQQQAHSLALFRGEQTIWKFTHDPKYGKPYFDPLALPGGSNLTWQAPPDHPWHHGLWWSWKFINRKNYWEENRRHGKSEGQTRWRGLQIKKGKDFSAHLVLDLVYHLPGSAPVVWEKRSIAISPPGPDGSYHLDWQMTFTAGSGPVEFSRTPLPDEPGGKIYGGYAGLSCRLAKGLTDRQVVSSTGQPIAFTNHRHRSRASAFDYTGLLYGKPCGVAILDHPANLNAPSPWYIIRSPRMNFFSPAVICYGPHTLKAGGSFTLRYRVIIHPGRLTAAELAKQAATFAKQRQD